MTDLLSDCERELLLGNEAVVRGLIEAGVRFASTYPGTPSSEIGNILEQISDRAGMYFEFSSNEKVAMEVSAAAASSGVRSFVFMKHVGLNVAADPMMTLAYAGVKAGMLILTADDPSAHSSQNEQDNRYYSTLSMLPMVEPSTPQEAKDMIPEAYRLSEELGLPVIFRTTTRVNHARGVVEYGRISETPAKGHFVKDDARFVNIPAYAKLNRVRLLELNDKAEGISEKSPLNKIEGKGRIGIITSGVGYTYVKEHVSDVSILKLGMTNPLPEKMIVDFVKGKDKVIIVEELEPFLEDQVLRFCAQNSVPVKILGKRSGLLPRAWEYSPDTMIDNLSKEVPVTKRCEALGKCTVKLPGRPPTLCAGCPHRGMYAATKAAVGKKEVVYCSDIGCYTLGVQPPFRTADFIICMGGGAGAAGGFDAATDQKAIAFIGDSTFFHAGVPALTSALFNDHKIVMVILDNRTTAMTGHQPNPGTGRHFGNIDTSALDVESVVKGLGIGFVETVDPYDVKASEEVMRKAIDFDGVAVVISKRACPLELKKQKLLKPSICTVDKNKCIGCGICLKTIACPALMKSGKTVSVDTTQCIGCGMCGNVCPKGAIEVRQ